MQHIVKTICDEAKQREILLPELLIAVQPSTQRLHLFQSLEPVKTYTISTSKFGLGGEEGSYKTPTGLHEVADRIGAGEAAGRVFGSREPLGECIPPADWTTPGDTDLILTRILRLRGLEADNALSYPRYIYLHGTNQEQLLGTAASHGCIRMGNYDIIELFDTLGEAKAVCWIAPA